MGIDLGGIIEEEQNLEELIVEAQEMYDDPSKYATGFDLRITRNEVVGEWKNFQEDFNISFSSEVPSTSEIENMREKVLDSLNITSNMTPTELKEAKRVVARFNKFAVAWNDLWWGSLLGGGYRRGTDSRGSRINQALIDENILSEEAISGPRIRTPKE